MTVNLRRCRLVAAIVFLALPAFCQIPMVLHSEEAIITISVRGHGVPFIGSCLSTRGEGASVTTGLKDTVPDEFTIAATAICLTVQNLSGGKEPEVRVGSDSTNHTRSNGSRIPAARQGFSTGLSEGISRNITRRELVYITGWIGYAVPQSPVSVYRSSRG